MASQSFEEFCDYAILNLKSFPQHTVELFIRLMEEGKQAKNKVQFMKNLEQRIARVNENAPCKSCKKKILKINNEISCGKHFICKDCKEDSILKTLDICMDCELDKITDSESIFYNENSNVKTEKNN